MSPFRRVPPLLLFLFAIPGLAAPVEPPLPWTKLGAKSYTLTVESARDAPGLDVSRSVTTPLTMRTVSRGDAEGVVRWEFGPATVEGDECEQDWLDIQLALAPGVVRPAIEMRIEDFGGLVEVVNRKAALDAFLRILDEHPQPACVDVQPSDWVEEVESLQGRTLAGSAVELFLMLLGAPLDTEEPTVYEDSLEQHISMVDVPARAEWRVVAHDARTVTVAWSRTAHPDAGAKALRRAADDLVARGGTITKAEAAIPGYVGATEKAELVIDRKSGWPTKLSYERMEHIGMYKVFSRVRFVAR